MDELAAFVDARLAEDETAARLAIWSSDDDAATWTAGSRGPYEVAGRTHEKEWYVVDGYDEGVIGTVRPQAAADEAVAEHIARYDPARALREVEAGRRILARHVHVPSTTPWTGPDGTDFGCRECGYEDDYGTIAPTGWCDDLRDLLYRWADHPDYRQEWRPKSEPEAPAEAT